LTDATTKAVDDAIEQAKAGAFEKAAWMDSLRANKDGKTLPTLYNSLLVLENDKPWAGVIAFDEFAYRIVKRLPPPTRVSRVGEWSDLDDVQALAYISEEFGFEPKKNLVMDAVLAVAHQKTFHPVREYLEGLQWDGTARLPLLMSDYFGAISTPATAALEAAEMVELSIYLRLLSIKWLVGAVARVMEPGCKLDTMVVLEGGQGEFKSSTLRALFGPEWFSDSKLVVGDKDALAQMQGKWCYEMAEMDSHSKADTTAFKQFMSSQVDRVRWHYGRRAEDVPRQSVFVGTTNMDEYGKDETGMRRIWPATVGYIDRKKVADDRDQLWAEAVHYYHRKARWWVDKEVIVIDPEKAPYTGLFSEPVNERELFDRQAEERMQIDAWSYRVQDWLDKNNRLPYVTTADILGSALGLDTARWSKPEQMRAAAILRRLGFKRQKVGPKNARIWGFVPPADAVEPSFGTAILDEADDLPI